MECAALYVKNPEGKYVIESQALNLFVSIRPLLNVVRKRGYKEIFMTYGSINIMSKDMME